jgi:hypothetical protein
MVTGPRTLEELGLIQVLLERDPPLAGVGPEVYMLECQRCHFEESVAVAHCWLLYQAMNARHWTLIPSQHNTRVRGLCRACWPLALSVGSPAEPLDNSSLSGDN